MSTWTDLVPDAIEKLRVEIVEGGIKALQGGYSGITQPEKLKGALQGFEICQKLKTRVQFEAMINFRRQHEEALRMQLPSSDPEAKDYWEFRYATLQIEFVYDQMMTVWPHKGEGPVMISAQAAMDMYERLQKHGLLPS